MATILNRTTTFATNGTVTAAGLHNLIDDTAIYAGLITTQTELTTVGTADQLLIAVNGVSDTGAPRRATVQNLFDDALSAGTYTGLSLTGALTYGTATGNRTVSTSATITTGTIPNLTSSTANITLGTIPTLTAGTTTSTAANITNGTVQTLTASTANISQGSAILTQGTIATLNSTTGTIGAFNSTTGTIATLNSTTGTIPTLVATTLVTTGTGTAAAPAIVPTGDTNTGIFFPAADTLAATTNGTERLRIASAGQFGIGGANYGTSGQVLKSGGASTAPSWSDVTFPMLSTSSTEADNVAKRTAKAWVNFNGTGTIAIRDAFNVSSITDNGAGDYTINFSSALTNANYSATNMTEFTAYPGSFWLATSIFSQSTTQLRIKCQNTANSTQLTDIATVCIDVFG